jgi:inosine/xanthosine triphosphate pyrophosphatase family protein
MRLLLATHNEHKRRELARLLIGHEVEMLPADVTLPPEEGATFAENALGEGRRAGDWEGEHRRRFGDRSRGARRRTRGALGTVRR